ncbi:phiSA1p31-related protein [Streptomyces sp. NPDC014623]|uniref:phiSA1p31-related protein n=1 Tax=Streptomyces sp. NPDC014623 TaxID=3364875 RepID=UPI0036FAC31C
MRIQLIDHAEHALVVTLTREGRLTVAYPGFCGAAAAEVLRDVADRLIEAHGPAVCHPDAEPEPQHDSAETLGQGGSLDADRAVWTDGTGHAWDLSVTWGSAGNLRWWWTGGHTEAGVPLMRTGDGTDEQPLDLVWALYGPLFPTAGDRA